MATDGWRPYCGPAPAPAELMGQWNFDIVVGGLAAAAIGLFVGMHGRPGFKPWRYAGALAVFFVVFVSPLCALSSALFSARVGHHLLLLLVAAPLLAGSLPRTLPFAGGVLSWTAMQALVLWAWHAPAAYEAALSSPVIYWLMQASLTGVAVGFWSAVRRSTTPSAVSALIVAMLPMGLLGAILTFSPAALYTPHLFTTASWGLSPEEDQQFGGLMMWAPAAAFYLAAALAVFNRTLVRQVRQS